MLALFLVGMALCARAGDITSLRPRPKAAFERTGKFVFSPVTFLVRPVTPTQSTWAAIEYVQRAVRSAMGDTLLLVTTTQYVPGSHAVFIGERSQFANRLAAVTPAGETAPGAQGYVLDIAQDEILLVGSDSNGTFYGASTLVQLMNRSGAVDAHCAHIWDEPDFPIRWAFTKYTVNAPAQCAQLRALIDTMALRKFTGIQQGEFHYGVLSTVTRAFTDSMTSYKAAARQSNLEIIPGVANIGWSNAIVYMNPNLAEGLPTTQTYVVEADTGRELPDTRVALPNGNFEKLSAGIFTTGANGWDFIDGQGTNVFVDSVTVHGGKYSARCENFRTNNAAGNARFIKNVVCTPRSYYILTAWVRTQNYSGNQAQLLVVGSDGAGNSRNLTSTDYHLSGTNGWQKVEIAFNTLEFTKLGIYCGTWGGNAGTIWWDDISVYDAGLTNILRRGGTPLIVRNKRTNTACVEGVDFATLKDSILNVSHGRYAPYHTPPTLRRIASGTVRNGDTLVVSFYHPVTTIVQVDGTGQVMTCLSEDTLKSYLLDEAARIDTLLHPRTWFLSHDEARVIDRDSICVARGETPAAMFNENIRYCDSIVKQRHAGAKTVIWSDMIDSLHNAHDNYYLVNGDLTGDWNGLPRSILVANWNSPFMAKSLRFFAAQGFEQISCPYFDAGTAAPILAWRRAQDTVAGQRGGVYTTWTNDYRFLTAFADYYWSAGPYIMHMPLDTTVLAADTIRFTATIVPDPNDATDTIAAARVEILDTGGAVLWSVALARGTGNTFTGVLANLSHGGIRYRIVATNSQGFVRTGIAYLVGIAPTAWFSAPVAVAPANGATCVPPDFTLRWSSVTGADNYHLQVSSSSTFATTLIDASAVVSTQYPVLAGVQGHVYYWRVRAEQGSTVGPWSAVARFTTRAAAPAVREPADSSRHASPVIFAWDTVPGATTYLVHAATSAEFTDALAVIRTRATRDSVVITGAPGTVVHWRVRVNDSALCGEWSEPRMFTLRQYALPGKVQLEWPLHDTLADYWPMKLIPFRWRRPQPVVNGYEFMLMNMNSFVIEADDSSIVDTTYAIAAHVMDPYTWIVRAHNSEGWGPWSDTGYFFTEWFPGRVGDGAGVPGIAGLTCVPNPFSSQTSLIVDFAEPADATVSVVDILGRERARVFAGHAAPGRMTIPFHAAGLPAGLYYLRLTTPRGMLQRGMMIVR